MKRALKYVVLFILGLAAGYATAQSTTVSITVQSPVAQPWINGTVSYKFKATPGFGGASQWQGADLPSNFLVTTTLNLDNTGSATFSLPSNTAITPAGSKWTISVCPQATVQCVSTDLAVSGATQDISSTVNANINAISVEGQTVPLAYQDAEVKTTVRTGAMYYNTSTLKPRIYNGTIWTDFGGGGGGSGNVIASPQFQVGYYPLNPADPTIQGVPSNFTSDSAGNIRVNSYDQERSAYAAQTTPTSNNGIANALATPNSFVVAFPDYARVEGTFQGSASCISSFDYRDAIGCPPAGWANNTFFIDKRSPGTGFYAYNTNVGNLGGFWEDSRWVSNQQAQASGGGALVVPFTIDFEMTGSGKNGFESVGGPDSYEPYLWAFENMRRGIVSVLNIQQQDYSMGDNHLLQFTVTNNRGTPDGSAEGFNTIRSQISQNLTPMRISAASNLAAGATVMSGTLTSSVPFIGDGTYLNDITKGGPLLLITNSTDPGAAGPNTAGQITVKLASGGAVTNTPDIIGTSSTVLNTPKQYYGATTNETFTVTGLSAPITTASTICVADAGYQESARVISVGSLSGGSQSVTAALRYVHGTFGFFYVAQGAHACNFIEVRANQFVSGGGVPPGRQIIRLIGANSANTYLYARTGSGFWEQLFSGYATGNFVAPAGTTLTRNGSNTVSVPVFDPNLFFTNIDIIVAGCADSSFNGLFAVTSDNSSTVTWTNTGAAGTTTCTLDIEIQSRINGFSARSAQEFPGAEIVNTNDATTFALGSNPGSSFSVEPNTNLHVASGDALENAVYHNVQMGFDHNVIVLNTQTSPSIPDVMHTDQIAGFIPESTVWTKVSFTEDPSLYLGFGGTKNIGNALWDFSNSITPFNVIFQNLPTPQTAFASFQSCLFGCDSPKSQFTLFSWPILNGSGGLHVNQNTGTYEENYQATGIGRLTIDKNPAFISIVLTNGVNGIINNYTSSQWSMQVNGPSSGQSNQIQTFTSWSIDVPASFLNLADGCAQIFSHVLTSTGVACGSGGGGITLSTTGTSGPATLVGTTLNIPVYSGGGGGNVSTSGTTTSGTYPLFNGTTTITNGGLTDSGTIIGSPTESFVLGTLTAIPTGIGSYIAAAGTGGGGFGGLIVQESASNATNAKIWDQFISTNTLNFRAVNDAYNAANNWMTVVRSGFTISSITVPTFTDSALTNGNCVQAGAGGILTTIGNPCNFTGTTITLPTSSIAANTCTSPATATITGLTTSSLIISTFASDPAAVNGWGASGGLVFTSWPTSNTVNWEVCNQTASPIVPGAMTLNVGAR